MDVIVPGSVRELEHDGSIGSAHLGGISGNAVYHRRLFIPFRVVLQRGHEALRVVAVVQAPVVHAAAGNAVMVGIRSRGYKQCRHGAAKAKSLYTNLFRLYIRQTLEPAGPGHKIGHFYRRKLLVDGIRSGTAVVPGGAAIGNELDDAVPVIPVVAGSGHPAVVHQRRVRTAVNIHVHRVTLSRIEVLGIVDDARQFQPVRDDADQLTLSTFLRRREGSYRIAVRGLPGLLEPNLVRGVQVGHQAQEVLPVRRETDIGHIQRRIRKGGNLSFGRYFI